MRQTLLLALSASACSVTDVGVVRSQDTIYLDIRFEQDPNDPERPPLEEVFHSESISRPIIGLNQIVRGNAPGVIKARLRDAVNVIEIIWPGLPDLPLYSFTIDRSALEFQSIEVTVSSLSYAVTSESKSSSDIPVIINEPNKRVNINVTKTDNNSYSLAIPSDPVWSILSFLKGIDVATEPGVFEASKISPIHYGQRTYSAWNEFQHVTTTEDTNELIPTMWFPSTKSYGSLVGENFATVVWNSALKLPSDTHYPERDWTFRTIPPGARIWIAGQDSRKQTEDSMRVTDSKIKTVVFELKNYAQCPYEDAEKKPLQPGYAILTCTMQRISPP